MVDTGAAKTVIYTANKAAYEKLELSALVAKNEVKGKLCSMSVLIGDDKVEIKGVLVLDEKSEEEKHFFIGTITLCREKLTIGKVEPPQNFGLTFF